MAQSAGPGQWSYAIGGGALLAPEYPGSDKHKALAVPDISVKYSNRFSVDARQGIRYNFVAPVNTGSGFDTGLTLGGGLGPDTGRDQSASHYLNGMGDIDLTVEGRLYADYRFKYLQAGAALARGLGDKGHGGSTFTASVSSAIPLPVQGFVLIPRISLTRASSAYMQSYFGVTPTQAAASGYGPYTPGAGFKDISAGLVATKKQGRNRSLTATVGYRRLLGDAAKSPLTKSSNQLSAGIFTAYEF